MFQGKGLPQDNEADIEMEDQEDNEAVDASRRGANKNNANPSKAPKDIPAP